MVTQYHEPYIWTCVCVCVCLRWRIYIPMYFEDSKFQWPTRLIWIGHPRFTTLGCFILALTAVPTKKHPTEVFGWLANKTVCACVCSIILLKGTKHHLQWCGLAEFPKYFQGRGFHVFLPTGPTKIPSTSTFAWISKRNFRWLPTTPRKFNSSPLKMMGMDVDPWNLLGVPAAGLRDVQVSTLRISHTTIAPVVFNGWRVNFTSLVVKFMVVV